MFTLLVNSVAGFLFWLLAARFYSVEDIGIAVVLLSAMSLPLLLSRLGLDQSLIRYFPDGSKSRIYASTMFVTGIASIVFGTGLVLVVPSYHSHLASSVWYLLVFFLFLASGAMLLTTGITFVAIRHADYYFLQTLVSSSRVVFLPFVAFLGSFGIFSSVGLSTTISLVISFILVRRSGLRLSRIDFSFLKSSISYSAGNYIAGLLTSSPALIMPILTLAILGPEETAIYNMAYIVASVLYVIPAAFSTSLFVEGSHGESLKRTVTKSLAGVFAFLTPCMVAIILLSNVILGLFGESYSEGATLLGILALSGFFVSLQSIFFSVKRIQKSSRALIAVGALLFVIVIGSSYPLMMAYGVDGIGYSWLFGYGATGIVALIMLMRKNGLG
jgi:O-antigen/teichoic acid export membrane protein